MPIRRRLMLLTACCALGGILFTPFLSEGMRAGGTVPATLTILTAILFAGSAIVGGLCSWGGLWFADRAGLPMPALRSWEQQIPLPNGALRQAIGASLIAGGLAGITIGALVHALHVPANPGNLTVRLLTVFFAATVPEIVVHLFAMSALVLFLRRTWLAILLSSALFVLIFHGGSVGSAATTALVLAGNFAFGTLTGWLYKRFGFESAVLTHAVGHLIVLGWN